MPYSLADQDFYLPFEKVPDADPVYSVDELPEGWNRGRSGVWTVYSPPSGMRAGHGWKVHVSATKDRAQPVLDIASRVLIDSGIPFKHLSDVLRYTWLHHKVGNRAQSGKFIAAYPPDADSARRLMELLSESLRDESGPHILGDRRFRDSNVVAYRYGSFRDTSRTRPDGLPERLVPDGSGELVPDQRGVTFILPAGVTDPFAAPTAPAPPTHTDSVPQPDAVTFDGLRFERVLQRSSGGAAYQAATTDTGLRVFVKEARAHVGLHWNGTSGQERLLHEHTVLSELHEKAPGVAPRPLSHFRRWENTFLVTEFVQGRPLRTWMVENLPSIKAGSPAWSYEDYYARCVEILDQLREQISTLHAAGHVFVDMTPNNVMVDDEDQVRLIDFEAAARSTDSFPLLGTDGFFPKLPQAELKRLARENPQHFDWYGLSGIARFLLGPLYDLVQREPGVLRHVRHSLEESAPVPRRLWREATRFTDPEAATSLPSPEAVAADPLTHLRLLRDRTADAILAMADPKADVVFPTVPRGYESNTRSVAYGTAGVLHALRLAGRETDPEILSRLAESALRERHDAAPGITVGSAGVAWVLADHGMLEEAGALLDAAERHPVLAQRATLGEGTAGVALTHLALYGHDGDERHLRKAAELRASIPEDGPGLAALMGYNHATGLLNGRAGIALLDHYLHRMLGEEKAHARGLGLLRTELLRARPSGEGGVAFPVSDKDTRSMIYLYAGSAGFATVATRYLDDLEDDRDADLRQALAASLTACRTPFTVYSGLFEGRAGLVFALAEHASRTGDRSTGAAAVDAARRLYGHAVAHPTGARFVGEGTVRFSTDLATGSAGVLLALTRLLDDRADMFFTLDALAARMATTRG
ncbi:class III lanthionine synthetase LanKC [Streptomyces sp. NPDC046860]|uniref:class III lanthionine synthetase LanKC n=1 Tax=Streptomyces sp. NPDC046860 TaxID=3154495 RepID=UPI0033F57B67